MIARTQEVMGTVVSYLIDPRGLSDDHVEFAIEAARHEFVSLDERFSTWKPSSELSEMRAGRARAPSTLMEEVIDLCRVTHDLTKGFFDAWAMPGGFDPTGLVKGWAVERALRVLSAEGVTGALVNAGGDIGVLPGTSYTVGIQHPFDREALCAVVETDSSVATSGVYERGPHLVNPLGVRVAAVSATVVGGRLAIGDALATALCVGGTEVLYLLERIEGVEGFYVTPEGAMLKTSGMKLLDVSQTDAGVKASGCDVGGAASRQGQL